MPKMVRLQKRSSPWYWKNPSRTKRTTRQSHWSVAGMNLVLGSQKSRRTKHWQHMPSLLRWYPYRCVGLRFVKFLSKHRHPLTSDSRRHCFAVILKVYALTSRVTKVSRWHMPTHKECYFSRNIHNRVILITHYLVTQGLCHQHRFITLWNGNFCANLSQERAKRMEKTLEINLYASFQAADFLKCLPRSFLLERITTICNTLITSRATYRRTFAITETVPQSTIMQTTTSTKWIWSQEDVYTGLPQIIPYTRL